MERPPAPSNNPPAGGCLVAIGIIAGAAYGVVAGHATTALLIGTGVGIAAAVAVWLRERR
ncbi:MAG: hypothetical protein J0I47_09805 [Sphingomonas sp.]|uniref:hypothetical protein n=1 Tax=Sphingomonas sp. TaxID=28214 RepID=UPI001AD08E54|nr:hypothetical protein [Sphingomonas sp.]MBN8808507.1 hypothetical protein [Sphingomonas sp.]